jgi:hypothetical protein
MVRIIPLSRATSVPSLGCSQISEYFTSGVHLGSMMMILPPLRLPAFTKVAVTGWVSITLLPVKSMQSEFS